MRIDLNSDLGESFGSWSMGDDEAMLDVVAITTLIGGTVGGYITYAGAHRLLDSGLTGPEHAREIGRSSVQGIIVTAIMRVVPFLAVLGVVAGGATLAKATPRPAPSSRRPGRSACTRSG